MGPISDKSAEVALMESGGRSRLIAVVEVLLAMLVLLALTFPGVNPQESAAILAGLLCYAAFVLGARLLRRLGASRDWTLAAQTAAMVPFITWSMWFTDKLDSPLRNGLLLAILASALTQRMRGAMLQVALAALGTVALEESFAADQMLSAGYIGGLVARITPLIVVAYVTSLYSSQFRYDMNRKLRAASIDPVTGLANLSGFALAADWLLNATPRRDDPAALLLIGVTNLKEVASRHGPEAANEVMQQLARHMSARLRYKDFPARCADDEFAVLLPDTGIERARPFAIRLQQELASLGIEFGGARIDCRISAGLVDCGASPVSIPHTLARGDRALALAREQGGGLVAL